MRPNVDADAKPARFDELHLSKPLLKAVQALNYEQATPIQSAVIPVALQGKDILASAVTGSGLCCLWF
jgi:superfamily II DNA/RNA helicase